MKIKKDKITKENTMLSHAILDTITDSIIEKSNIKDKDEIEITLTIEGEEVDITNFFEHINSQFDRCVHEKAQELIDDEISEKVNKIKDFLSSVENHFEETLSKLKKL